MYRDLKLSDRARVIEMAVKSGITDLDTIEEVYNTFAEGGPKEKLIERINSTSDANFVQRLKDPNREYIVNPNGSISTHSMAYVTQDGRAIVYPEVQQINGSLVRVNPAEALDSAISRRDTLMMSIPEAEWFTTNYKNYYPKGDTFGEGGTIHIKKKNRGKFTALKKRTGHSASWFKAHGTPAQKKMAVFALNARKWKHSDGGLMTKF